MTAGDAGKAPISRRHDRSFNPRPPMTAGDALFLPQDAWIQYRFNPRLRISAIVDGCFSAIVDGVSA